MQGQKGKCKDDIKSYSLDRFEQVERLKIECFNKIKTVKFLITGENCRSCKNLNYQIPSNLLPFVVEMRIFVDSSCNSKPIRKGKD